MRESNACVKAGQDKRLFRILTGKTMLGEEKNEGREMLGGEKNKNERGADVGQVPVNQGLLLLCVFLPMSLSLAFSFCACFSLYIARADVG